MDITICCEWQIIYWAGLRVLLQLCSMLTSGLWWRCFCFGIGIQRCQGLCNASRIHHRLQTQCSLLLHLKPKRWLHACMAGGPDCSMPPIHCLDQTILTLLLSARLLKAEGFFNKGPNILSILDSILRKIQPQKRWAVAALHSSLSVLRLGILSDSCQHRGVSIRHTKTGSVLRASDVCRLPKMLMPDPNLGKLDATPTLQPQSNNWMTLITWGLGLGCVRGWS